MKSQQKCIVIFALLCCFAVLVALIFSAVDVWGEDEDGITEENCNKNCRVVLVENIPEDVTFSENGTAYLTLSAGLHSLLDLAVAGRSVEIVSPQWNLNSSDNESSFLPSSRPFKKCLLYDVILLRGMNWPISSLEEDELANQQSTSSACPYHNPTATMGHSVHNIDISKPVAHTAPYTLSAIYLVQLKPGFICEEHSSPASQWPSKGQALLQRLQGLKKKGVNLKIASGMIDSVELKSLSRLSEVHYINMTALTKGFLHSSFWVVDRKHIYIGSATMDWRSLSMMKELGIIIYNCSCLALDLHRVFNLYWQLQYKDFVPSIWSKRLSALWNKDENLPLLFNNTKAEVFLSSSPDVFCPKDRTRDLDAISYVIQKAKRFIYISITDYLPLTNRNSHRYWSGIDGMLREALILRNIKVRLLVSCWEQTHPLTFNFVWSLKTLCMELPNCSLEAKFFSTREQRDGTLQGINHNRFIVTDSAVYIGNFDWVGNEFMFNAGAGMVISQAEGLKERNSTLVEQVRAAFQRDWYSRHTKSLQANKIPVCNKHQLNQLAHLKITQPPESSGSQESPNGSL